jgi:hypothetical protein
MMMLVAVERQSLAAVDVDVVDDNDVAVAVKLVDCVPVHSSY